MSKHITVFFPFPTVKQFSHSSTAPYIELYSFLFFGIKHLIKSEKGGNYRQNNKFPSSCT